MTKKILSIVLCAVLALSVFAGCGQSSTPAATQAPAAPAAPAATQAPAATEAAPAAPEAAPAKDYTIAVMVKDSSTPFWRYLVSGAMEAGTDLGVNVVEYAPMEAQSLDEQTKQVEDAIQAGVDAI